MSYNQNHHLYSSYRVIVVTIPQKLNKTKLLQGIKDKNTSVALNWKTRLYSPPLTFERSRSQKQSAKEKILI